MEKMVQKMMKRFPMFIGMGFMIVMIALIIGAITAGNAATLFSLDKAGRDTTTQAAQIHATVASTVVWLPYFKFIGVAMILAGITMALGVIATRLENLGKEVMAGVPQSARQPVPARPKSVVAMRMFMMLGMLTIIVGFFISLNVAGTAVSVFSNTIATIDGAVTNSALLTNFASIHATEAWLEAFKFVGVAFFFMGIIFGLKTIIFALKYQQQAIPQVVEDLPPSFIPAPAVGD